MRVIAELAHRLHLAARASLDAGAHPLRVVERQGDLGPAGGVSREIDALPPALAEESPDPVAAGDLGRDIGGQRLGRSRVALARALVKLAGGCSETSSVPQESQNRAPSRFSFPQDGQRISADYPNRVHREIGDGDIRGLRPLAQEAEPQLDIPREGVAGLEPAGVEAGLEPVGALL